MHPLDTLTPAQLDALAREAVQQAQTGQLPTYIPALEAASADEFAAYIHTVSGQCLGVGDRSIMFPLMSVIKPFLLLYLLERLGEAAVFQWVGVQTSEYAYNSLVQLEADNGFPRNPMLNSGAIALCGLLGQADRAWEPFCRWLNEQAQVNLQMDHDVLASVRSLPNERNRAIAQYLASTEHLAAPADTALGLYEAICCISANVFDLAQLGLLLVSDRLPARSRQVVTALMTTCGLYQYSSAFAVDVGLPCKSGVSGAVLAVVPRQGAIACYSPPLDIIGNSVASLWFLRQLVSSHDLHLFG